VLLSEQIPTNLKYFDHIVPNRFEERMMIC